MIDCYENCKDIRNGVCPPIKMFCPKKLAEHDSELLDKVAEKIKEYSGLHYVDCDGYFGGEKELIFKVDDWLDEIITELKAEIE